MAELAQKKPRIVAWRDKCIEEFKLRAVPEAWQDEVARGSERAWENYYHYRKKQEETLKNDDSNDDDDDESEGIGSLEEFWGWELDALEDEVFDAGERTWSATLKVGYLVWDPDMSDVIRTAELYGHVWSPYAIPHAIKLQQRYHRRPRYSTMEFCVVWGYKLLDFEEHGAHGGKANEEDYTTICSNCFEDEALRADVIETSNLNRQTLDHLRRFLFGTVDASKQIVNDLSFLLLLFGSMGTFKYETLKRGWIGYEWDIPYNDKGLKERMVKEGIIKNENECIGISWLEHAIRQASGAFRPVDKYYRPPTIKDALGYHSSDGYSSSSDEST